MAPMVHGLEAKYFGKIKFSYLEISNPQTADFRKYLGFEVRPSFYLLDAKGKLLHEWIGYQTQDQFEQVFAQYVK
jgi:thioredoxin-related protein